MEAPSRESRTILVVSDLHCGSIYGLLPPRMQDSNGKVVSLNKGQEYLWECWVHMAKFAARFKPDVVVVNGDVIDGTQRAQHGTELALPLLEDQAYAAEVCLKFLDKVLHKRSGKKPQWYFVQGTEYHDQKAGREVESVAKALGAVRYEGPGTGRWSREVLDLEVKGVTINFMHGISVSQGFYRATALDREGIFSALAGKFGMAPAADIVVRSHVHTFNHVHHYTKHIMTTPCWQLQTRYMRRLSAYRMLPHIGALLLVVDPKRKREGRDPLVHLELMIYPLPERKPVPVAI